MVRREIKNFEICIGSEKYSATVPFTLRSASDAEGVLADNIGEVRLESDIYVDDVALSMRNFYLRFRDISSPAKVYIGEHLIGELDGQSRVYNLSVGGLMAKGNNRLSIRISASEVSDISLVGMRCPVEILRFSGAIINKISTGLKFEGGEVNIGITLDLIGDASRTRAVATLHSSTGQLYYAGLTAGCGSITVKDPLLWWPRGQGVQNLYRLTVSLYGEGDVEDSMEIRLGLRTASAAEGGNILVNGQSIIPLGATYIPDGSPDTSAAERSAAELVTAAAMVGYNCLVIPDGAPTPTDKFYELCDIHGIMVIEEHSTLDGYDIAALSDRASHPSLVLVDLVGDGDRRDRLPAIREAVPDLSVRIPDERQEYLGLPSLPSMKTVRAAVPEDERSLFSHSIEAIAEEGAICNMLLSVAERYPYPKDLSAFAYASALASANKVGETIKRSRTSGGLRGRGVFSRLNDSTMAISPSAIDCRGRWKPLHYYSAGYFAPVALYADLSQGAVSFSASSQRRTALVGNLEYRIADSANFTVYKDSVSCQLEGMSYARLHTAEIGEYIAGHEREYYLEYTLKEGSSVVSRGVMLFVPEKHFKFKRPKIKAVITGQDRRFSITLASDVFVKDMELSFDGIDAVFSDNYFDITSDAPVRIDFTLTGGAESAYRLKDALEMRSVVDIG